MNTILTSLIRLKLSKEIIEAKPDNEIVQLVEKIRAGNYDFDDIKALDLIQGELDDELGFLLGRLSTVAYLQLENIKRMEDSPAYNLSFLVDCHNLFCDRILIASVYNFLCIIVDKYYVEDV